MTSWLQKPLLQWSVLDFGVMVLVIVLGVGIAWIVDWLVMRWRWRKRKP